MALRVLFVAALVAISQAQEYKNFKCKSTGTGMWDPICAIKGLAGETYGSCTDKNVAGISGSYFSVDKTVTPLCYTYVFETTETSGFGAATYLFRGVNLDSSINSCEKLCSFIREVQGDGKEIKNLYVGCTNEENKNDEDVAKWWRTGTEYKCSTDNNYAKPGDLANKPVPEGPTVTVIQKVTAPQFLNFLVIAGVAIVGVALMIFLPGITACYFIKKQIN